MANPGKAVITIDPLGVGSGGNRRVVIGTVHLSTTYLTGGDTFDPTDMGLQVLDDLVIGPAVEPGGTFILLQATVTPLASSIFLTGSPAGLMIGLDPATGAEVSAGDQHTFVARYVAFGT